MVHRNGRGRFPRFRGRGRRPYRNRNIQQRDISFDDNGYQTNNYSDSPVDTGVIQEINDHLGNVDDFEKSPSPAPVAQQQPQQLQQSPQVRRRRTKQPGWTIEEEVKLVNYVCNNLEFLNRNKKLFWRDFGRNSEKILNFSRFPDACKTKFYSIVARYRQNVDLYNAIERYLYLEKDLVSLKRVPLLISQNTKEQHEEITSLSNETQTPNLILLSETSPPHTQAESFMETIDQNSHDTSDIKSGTTSLIDDSSSPIPENENAVAIISRNTQAVTFCNYNTASNSHNSYNDFPSFVKGIRQQIVAAQDYLNREKSRAENHINSLDSVLYLFSQLEDQLQRMR